uniref:C-type lectin domain-containing protein n=1 Tax=Acrobeloides nanus TaxID=290746 RepID=A0A914DGX5_9BILA
MTTIPKKIMFGSVLFVTFFFIFIAIGSLPRHCGNGWKYFEKTKSCYKLSYDAPWREAEENCTSYSGHLASIHSSEENNFVAQLVFNDLERDTENDKFIWIGGVSLTLIPGREDQILWLDNTPYDYTAQNFMNMP